MDTIDWNNALEVADAQKSFNHYVTAWNPCQLEHQNLPLHQSAIHNPCLLDIASIFKSNQSEDYTELVNCVQRHTKCHESSCLRKKDTVLSCWYGVQWELNSTSLLFIDDKGHNTYAPTHNDERLNIHNADLLSFLERKC